MQMTHLLKTKNLYNWDSPLLCMSYYFKSASSLGRRKQPEELCSWKTPLGCRAITPGTEATRYLGKGLSGEALEKRHNSFLPVTPGFMCAVPSSPTVRRGQGWSLSSPALFASGEQKSNNDGKHFSFFCQGEECICVGRMLNSKRKRAIVKFISDSFYFEMKKKNVSGGFASQTCVGETWYSLGRCHLSIQHLETAEARTKPSVHQAERVHAQGLLWLAQKGRSSIPKWQNKSDCELFANCPGGVSSTLQKNSL